MMPQSRAIAKANQERDHARRDGESEQEPASGASKKPGRRLANKYRQWISTIGAQDLASLMDAKKQAERPLVIPAVEALRKGNAAARKYVTCHCS